MASLALVSKYGMPPLDWQNAMARFDETFISRLARCHVILESWKQYHALALLYIHLVAEHDLLAVSLVLGRVVLAQARLTKGKLSGSIGLAWIKNSSLQLSRVSKLLELLTS
jgi:hypothetical protein